MSLKPLLAAVRKRHLAAGFPNPCNADSVREAKSGFRRAGLALRPQPSRAVVPLPSTAAWSLALLATYSPRALRHRLTAVICAFWWMRRAKDLLLFTLADVNLPPDGRTCFLVRYHKTAAGDGPISRELPPADAPDADVPRQLLVRLLADRRAADAGPADRLFSDCHPSQASTTLTTWLREGLARVGVSAPVGARYASHSLKKGGATSANAAGVPRGAISEYSNTSELTLAETYISALATASPSDRCFFGRLCPASAGRGRRPYST